MYQVTLFYEPCSVHITHKLNIGISLFLGSKVYFRLSCGGFQLFSAVYVWIVLFSFQLAQAWSFPSDYESNSGENVNMTQTDEDFSSKSLKRQTDLFRMNNNLY